MIEVVVGPLVDRDALRRQPVPAIELVREQREHGAGLVVAHVVAADLAADCSRGRAEKRSDVDSSNSRAFSYV